MRIDVSCLGVCFGVGYDVGMDGHFSGGRRETA